MRTSAVVITQGTPRSSRVWTATENLDRDTEEMAQTLSSLRKRRRQEFISEGITRITTSVPEWDTFERVALIASIFNMFGNPPNAAQNLAKDIYLFVKNTALPKLTLLTLVQLQAVSPTAADPFDDGTLWPT